MYRAGLIAGIVIDLTIAALLLVAVGWVIDSWNDHRVAYTGLIVTTAWLMAFALSVGSAALGYALHRRKAAQSRVIRVVWIPAFLLVTLCVGGLILSPP